MNSNVTIPNSPVRQVNARVEYYTNSTLVSTFTNKDRIKSVTIERVADTGKFFGYGVCQKVNIKLRDMNRELDTTTADSYKVFFSLEGIEGSQAQVGPQFFDYRTNRDENTNELSITAYDRLYNASEHKESQVTIAGDKGYTIGDMARAAASLLGFSGVIYAVDEFNLNYPNGANFDGKETLREVLNDIAEATQTIYFVDSNNNLVFKRLDRDGAAAYVITRNDYFDLDARNGKRLQTICSATELGDNVSASTSQVGSTQYVRNNPFWELREDIATLVQNAIDNVGDLNISQTQCKWRGNYALEIGDKILISTKEGINGVVNNCLYLDKKQGFFDGKILTINATVATVDKNVLVLKVDSSGKKSKKPYVTYLIDDTITYNGGLEEETKWEYSDNEEESESNPVSLGDALKQTYARVDKQNKQIEIVASKEEENDKAIGSLKVTTDKINESVSSMKTTYDGKIKSVEDRVSQVQLDNENISASVSSMKETYDGQLEGVDNRVSALEMNTDSINASVSSLQKTYDSSIEDVNKRMTEVQKKAAVAVTSEQVQIDIQSAMQNGVDKVQTSTGYTFDDDGLTINKSGSQMSTQVTEDGMTVKKQDEVMLTANNQGVDAQNLHATTYLIIGKNSRFEDYGARTGCFYIGEGE